MDKQQFYQYIENPELLKNKGLEDINELLDEYPYFQTARLLLVKSLHQRKDIKFNNQLKLAAAYIGNRKKLYYLLNNEEASLKTTKEKSQKTVFKEKETKPSIAKSKKETSSEKARKEIIEKPKQTDIKPTKTEDTKDTKPKTVIEKPLNKTIDAPKEDKKQEGLIKQKDTQKQELKATDKTETKKKEDKQITASPADIALQRIKEINALKANKETKESPIPTKKENESVADRILRELQQAGTKSETHIKTKEEKNIPKIVTPITIPINTTDTHENIPVTYIAPVKTHNISIKTFDEQQEFVTVNIIKDVIAEIKEIEITIDEFIDDTETIDIKKVKETIIEKSISKTYIIEIDEADEIIEYVAVNILKPEPTEAPIAVAEPEETFDFNKVLEELESLKKDDSAIPLTYSTELEIDSYKEFDAFIEQLQINKEDTVSQSIEIDIDPEAITKSEDTIANELISGIKSRLSGVIKDVIEEQIGSITSNQEQRNRLIEKITKELQPEEDTKHKKEKQEDEEYIDIFDDIIQPDAKNEITTDRKISIQSKEEQTELIDIKKSIIPQPLVINIQEKEESTETIEVQYRKEPSPKEISKDKSLESNYITESLNEYYFLDDLKQKSTASISTQKNKHKVQNNLIDSFINKNSDKEKIKPVLTYEDKSKNYQINENEELISETLTRIYIKQGYYAKAMKAYRKLSLKYPEKSSYFAEQIQRLEKLLEK